MSTGITSYYSLRSNTGREHWLLDISHWTGSQEASKNLAELQTDLDTVLVQLFGLYISTT